MSAQTSDLVQSVYRVQSVSAVGDEKKAVNLTTGNVLIIIFSKWPTVKLSINYYDFSLKLSVTAIRSTSHN